MTTRRTFLRTAAACLSAGFLPSRGRADDAPITGEFVPALAPFDDLMASFIAEQGVPGAALAVSRYGRPIYGRGFGFADVEKKTPVEPNSLFRLASVSKPITAIAVLQLAERGKVKLDDPVLNYIRLEPHRFAKLEPDPRWRLVTVRHCLHHTGGWDRQKSYDPIGIPQQIADALGTKPPIGPHEMIRYMLGRPLDFDPGARFAYSNLGYSLLGRVVEAATGRKYEEYVKAEVLAPLGVTRPQLGRAMPENRAKGEVRYYDSKKTTGICLYPPRAGARVPYPDGVANFEQYESYGGWIAGATDLIRLASSFDAPTECKLLAYDTIRTMWERPTGAAGYDAAGRPLAAYYGCGWSVRPSGGERPMTWHTGLISGTSTLLVRRSDGLNWAVLFNTDRTRDGKIVSSQIDPLVHDAANRVKDWPV